MEPCGTCGAVGSKGARFCGSCGRRRGAVVREHDGDTRIGQVVLGRFRLVERLGAGAMGAVYRAEQRMGRTTRPVAVKILHPHMSAEPDLRARFLRECELVVQLEHPNTIRFFDVGELEDGALAIVMELVEGETLSARLERGPMSWLEAEGVLVAVLGALGEAHAAGIVHRDVKPDNVMLYDRLDGGVGVKLLDFGVAQPPTADDTPLTLRGHLVGTPPYMSPEQLTGGRVDARSDLYAVGVMAYEMVAGAHPLGEARALVEWLTRHLDMAPTPLSAHPAAKGVPAHAERTIHRALAKAKENRPADAREMAADLRGASAVGPARAEASVRSPASGLTPRATWTPSSASGGRPASHRSAPSAARVATPSPAPARERRVDDDPPTIPRRRGAWAPSLFAGAILAAFSFVLVGILEAGAAHAELDPIAVQAPLEPTKPALCLEREQLAQAPVERTDCVNL